MWYAEENKRWKRACIFYSWFIVLHSAFIIVHDARCLIVKWLLFWLLLKDLFEGKRNFWFVEILLFAKKSETTSNLWQLFRDKLYKLDCLGVL